MYAAFASQGKVIHITPNLTLLNDLHSFYGTISHNCGVLGRLFCYGMGEIVLLQKASKYSFQQCFLLLRYSWSLIACQPMSSVFLCEYSFVRTRGWHFCYIPSHIRNFSEVWGASPLPLNPCALIDSHEHWDILSVNEPFLIHLLKSSAFAFFQVVFFQEFLTLMWICCAFGRWVEKLLVNKSLTTLSLRFSSQIRCQ